jgi:hypothetical protein
MTPEPTPEIHSVFVQFFGICTHISPDALTPPASGWTHRVVLVNASRPHELPIPRLRELEPHIATLQIVETDILDTSGESAFSRASGRGDIPLHIRNLHGVTMTIKNPVPRQSDTVPSGCMPSLSEYVRSERRPLQVSRHAFETNPADTACFFDFTDVTPLVAYRLGEAAFGTLQVFTSGHPVLEITPFGSELPSVAITLRPGAHISVCNLPEVDTKDSVDDFLLHYLIVDPFPFPDDLNWPPKRFDVSCPPLNPQNGPLSIQEITTAGCSNSNYP